VEAFDAVRRSAAHLHEEAVKEGADPLNPVSLVEKAVAHLGLELYRLEPGDPALKGARALFDDQSGSIFCERTDDAGEEAVLIGHEVGHACVHVASCSCSKEDVDASRPEEASPVGLQRVEDYGVRERQELQANVFSRELVFPRSLARLLFVKEGMNASEIATRLMLPKNLVRQQLFDALLLPETPEQAPVPPGPTPPVSRDPSQDRATIHRGSPFLLQAGPGTGKTRTLVKTVLKLLEEGVHPSAILILTYSNRAAGELSERIALAAGEASTKIWTGTFHAFGLDLLRRYHDKLGLPPQPPLFDKSDAVAVLEDLLPTMPLVHYQNLWDPRLVLRDIVSTIYRAKDELTDPKRYRALADEMRRKATNSDEIEAAEKCLEIALVYDHYEAALTKKGAVDFGDLIMRPALLLESDANVQAEVRLRHRHILVDEYQDVNRASARLLKAVAGDGKRLWVVGDARQSIYRFRGASSANMVGFGRDYPDSKADQLEVSYRSTQQVVDVVTSIAPRMGASEGMLPLAITADRGSGSSGPEIRRYESPDDEVEGVAASIRELGKKGVPLRKQAVLCRTNSRLSEIASALEARGIPVLHLGSLFEREEVRDLLSLMSLVADSLGDGLIRVAAQDRYGSTLQDVYLVLRWLQTSGLTTLTALPVLSQIPGLSPTAVEGLTRLAADLNGVQIAVMPWEFLATYLLDRTDVVREMSQAKTVQGRMGAVAVWQFLNFVREQSPSGSGLSIRRVLDRVRNIVLLAEERDLRQVPAAALHLDAVKLLTVHGSKGLEFEAVHVPGLTVAGFPLSYRGQRCPPPTGMIEGASGTVSDDAKQSHLREEECLFFVAVSRARTHLVLHLCQKQDNGNKRNPSPFLDWIPKALAAEVKDPARLPLPPGAPRPQPISVVLPTDWHVSGGQLGLYDKCPRRFFYTHVLGLRGARKITPFTVTHDCLYELMGWLADARRDASPTLVEAEDAFEAIWRTRGPIKHGYVDEYRRLASKLIGALLAAGAGQKFRDSEPIAINLPNGQVAVKPDEIAELPDGSVVLRRINTGQKSSDEYDRLDYVLYHLAGEARFGTRFRIDAVHLSDELVEVVTLSTKKISGKKEKSNEMLSAITAGHFPVEIDSVTCPRCPHFFVCSAVPKGRLTLL
jgi:DNA helicase-2/ATP-dependent DNA helicase PcrA